MNIQKTVTSFLKKHRNFIFFLVLAFAGVLSTLYVEYRFQ